MNRSDRYLGSYSYGDAHSTSNVEELELIEEDIWSHAIIHDTKTEDAYGHVGGLSLSLKGTSNALPSSPITAQQIHGGAGEEGETRRTLPSSVPVNVPDWSKIYRVNSVDSLPELDDEEEESGMMPPHEYLAKSQARRSRKTGGGGGATVFESVGMALKGRELRRVRDTIWIQTGFYG